MKDVQNEKPKYAVAINKVGISGIKYPINVLKKDTSHLHTISTMSTYVRLMPESRGTHMSRFIELIEKYKYDINGISIEKMVEEMITKLETDFAQVEIEFPYFIEKKSPVSKKSSLFPFTAGFLWINNGGKLTHKLKIKVVVTSLCPCSKEISKYGAHNQRAYITLVVKPKHGEFIWFEDLVHLVESCASSEIYPLLKRPDEKYVTEHAYDNPKFMEDVVREVEHKVRQAYNNINYIYIKAESEESIHQHLAVAVIEEEL